MADPLSILREGLEGRYTIERELGRGGMATVYLARDLRHERPVALKVLHPELAASLGPERFQREIRLAARLQHPHILTVLDSGETAGRLWFTMPFVEGESLRDRLRRERQLAVPTALHIAREAARALDYAHQHGVVHRDIKPENILLTRDGSTLVADFGIARALAGDDDRLTQTGLAVGTPAYMSPEQAAGDRGVDARTDLYSLAAVLYEMLAGEAPFSGPTAQAMIARRLSEPPPSIRRTRPNVPEAIDLAIQRALAPVTADRFADAGEFARSLQGSTDSSVTLAPAAMPEPTASGTAAVPTKPVSRRPVPVLAITLIAGFLLGLGVLFAWRNSRDADNADSAGGGTVLAVLPFENLGDSSTDYFADGVTDAVRGKLSALPGLRVIASRSANEYRNSPKELAVIGRELGSDYLLIGRIRWARMPDGSSRVEVSPELVELGSGSAPTTRWQQPIGAAMTDVFRVQAEIAGRVASALDVALGSGQQEALAERPTRNLAAYDAFLKGEAAQGLILADATSLRRSIPYYEQAVALDSSFALAWARLSRAHSLYYVNVTPTSANAAMAKRAAERAVALAPGRPQTQAALGSYFRSVRVDNDRALSAYETGLKSAPDDAELLSEAALAEQGLGRWEAAVTHLERARALDPRSPTTARRLGNSLLRLRRHDDALNVAEQGLTVTPGNLDLIQLKAMVHLARADLAGARAAIRSSLGHVEPAALAAHFGNYFDLYWVLEEDQQQLLLRLPPSMYDGDRGTWALVRAQTWHLHRDLVRARAYADTSRLGFEETLRATPDDAQRHVLLGLALAYMGRKSEAVSEGERSVALVPASRDHWAGTYLQHQLARIYILVGEPERALDRLEPLLRAPYYLSPGWLRIDPTFDRIRQHPRFRRLVAGTP